MIEKKTSLGFFNNSRNLLGKMEQFWAEGQK